MALPASLVPRPDDSPLGNDIPCFFFFPSSGFSISTDYTGTLVWSHWWAQSPQGPVIGWYVEGAMLFSAAPGMLG